MLKTWRLRTTETLASISLLWLALGTVGCGNSDRPPACADGLALQGVTVIDGLGHEPVSDQTVLICDGLIRAVAPRTEMQLPRDVTEADMTGRFVLPGLIDMHAHVAVLPLDDKGRVAAAPSQEDSMLALRSLLAFGVTTVRNPAAPAAAGVALREAVATGEVLGPRIFTAGEAFSPSALLEGVGH